MNIKINIMNSEEKKDALKKELELKNLQNNYFQEEKQQDDVLLYYSPTIEEFKNNHSLKPKIIKGFIFSKLY